MTCLMSHYIVDTSDSTPYLIGARRACVSDQLYFNLISKIQMFLVILQPRGRGTLKIIHHLS